MTNKIRIMILNLKNFAKPYFKLSMIDRLLKKRKPSFQAAMVTLAERRTHEIDFRKKSRVSGAGARSPRLERPGVSIPYFLVHACLRLFFMIRSEWSIQVHNSWITTKKRQFSQTISRLTGSWVRKRDKKKNNQKLKKRYEEVFYSFSD